MMLPVLLLSLPAALAPRIEWEKSLELAKTKASTEKKVVFLAVNFDGERASELLVSKTYKAKSIIALTERTVNVVACRGEHRRSGSCPRFAGVSCEDHQGISRVANEQILKPDAEGNVVAPQHVFLAPSGEVLLSVPYGIGEEELAWCFLAAIRAVDASADLPKIEGVRVPRRLIMGGVHVTADGIQPLTREDALAVVAELRKGGMGRGGGGGAGGAGGGGGGFARWREVIEKTRALLATDEEEVVQYLEQSLATLSSFRGFGGGGGGRGGGGGGGGEGRGARILPESLRAIGESSPESYAPLLEPFVKDEDAEIRSEAIVALEQIGSSESVRVLMEAWKTEKDDAVRRRILRALGTCGAGDRSAPKLLLKTAQAKKESSELRASAILALGWGEDQDTRAWLRALLESALPEERISAACALAIARDEASTKVLEEITKKESREEVSAAIEGSLSVLRGGNLQAIAAAVREVSQDQIPRRKLFGSEDT